MKTLSALVLAFVISTSGYLIKVSDVPTVYDSSKATSGWIQLQKIVLPLFENVCEISNDPMVVRLAQEFEQSHQTAEFWDPNVITNFQNLKTVRGFLPKGQIFSEYNPEHVAELEIIFNVLYNAKSFDAFFKAASWARQNLNCGLYVDVIYMAFEYRKDTEKLTLPPPYELLPNYFIRKDIIIQGSSLLNGQEITPTEGVRDEGNAYTLHANYTANFYDEDDDESKLAYFREDIGLNSYYFLQMLKRAPWLNKDVDINSQYGEKMYFWMKQFIGRYNMERYSNGVPEQDGIDWDAALDKKYDPMLVYSNGNEFVHMTSNNNLGENDEKVMLQTIENNLSTVVVHMRESGYNKTQILNHLMEILITSDKSYDILARRFLGRVLSNNGDPSILEHYMTSLRDPLFWKLTKTMVDLVDNALKVLPPYTKRELYFPGVEVVNIEAKKIMTSFDYYQFDITDALKIGNGDTSFQVKIGQTRLNTKPFSIKVNCSSLVTQKGLMKIYLGPKIMPGEFSKKKNQFILVDEFEINLKRGPNIVTRSSDDMIQFSPDFMSYRTLSKKVEDAQFGLNSLPFNSIDRQIRYPARLTIPKGTSTGLPLQLLVFVAPFTKANIGGSYTSNIEFNTAALSKLFPMDLRFEDNMLLDLPNVLMKEISVTHKGGAKANGVPGGSKPEYNVGGRPGTYNNGNSFSYNTQNEQDDFINHTNNQGYSNPTINDLEMVQSDGASTGTTGRLSGPSYDYSAYKKSFDYKSKRPQIEQVDYKSMYKNKATTTTTEIPVEDIDYNKMSEKVLINDNDIKHNEHTLVDEDSKDTEKYKDVESIGLFEVIRDDTNLEHPLDVIPILKLTVPKKKAFTIYDSILRDIGNFDNDDNDDNDEFTTIRNK